MHPAYYSFLQEKLKDKINFEELSAQKKHSKRRYSINTIRIKLLKMQEELAEITHIEERKRCL